MGTKIVLGYSKKKYFKKYKKYTFLLSFSKKEIGDYNIERASLNPEADHVLQGRKWALIGDTYYEIPKLFTGRWFKTLAIPLRLATILLVTGTVGASVGLPIYFVNFFYIPVSESIDELLPTDPIEKKLITETVDISNFNVKLGKDFDTTITVKDDHKEDYVIENSTKIYAEKDGQKVELVRDIDYTFENNGAKAEIKVFGKAVTGKLELDVKLREVSYNRIVKFEDEEHGFDNEEHPFKLTLNEGKTLPEGTLITYTYNGEVKTGDEFFSFKESGTYEVTLKLEHSEQKYKTFTKKATMTINKGEVPEEEKQHFDFEFKTIPEYDHETVPIPYVTEGGTIQFESYSSILYSDSEEGEWTEERPTAAGNYFVKTTLSFKNFDDMDLIKPFVIESYQATINFSLEDDIKGATWGEGGDKETKTVSSKVLTPGETTLKDFLDDAEISSTNNPYALGYTFQNKWKDENDNIYTDNTIIESTVGSPVTINLIPIFEGDYQSVGINTNKGHVFDKEALPVTNIAIKNGDSVLSTINNKLNPPIHDYASFSHWTYWNGTSDVDIDENTIMVPSINSIKPIWNTYNINIKCDGGTFIEEGEGKTLFSNRLEVYSDEVLNNITPNEGKVFDHFEFSTDDEATYSTITNSMPFRPYLENHDAPETVYLKAIYIDAPEIVEIFIDADKGSFDEEGTIKSMTLEVPFYGDDDPKNKSLTDVLNIVGTPKKDGNTPSSWVDDSGNAYDKDSKITKDTYVRAIYS